MINPWSTPQITALWLFFGVAGMNAFGVAATHWMLPRTPLAQQHECSGWASAQWVLSFVGALVLVVGGWVCFGVGIGAALTLEGWLLLTGANAIVRPLVERCHQHHGPTMLRQFMRDDK